MMLLAVLEDGRKGTGETLFVFGILAVIADGAAMSTAASSGILLERMGKSRRLVGTSRHGDTVRRRGAPMAHCGWRGSWCVGVPSRSVCVDGGDHRLGTSQLIADGWPLG